MAKRRFEHVNPVVFFVSAAVILLFVIAGMVFPEGMERAFGLVQALIVTQLGWFYIISVTFFLLFVLWLFVSPYGRVKLGKDDDEPEYSNVTWFAMLFSAGMGIGLLFFSVAELVMHFTDPPVGEPGTVAAAQRAMTLTFFHWGLHAWAVYIIVGMSLAYFAYRHDLPLTIRSTLFPLLGQRIYGPIGDAVEILAVFGTLFGVATSLGLGVTQINAGLEYLGLLDISRANQVILIAIITACATPSVVSGLDVGIRRLSELNLALGVLLLLFVFFVGPTIFLLSSFVESLGRYATSLVGLTFRTDAFIGTEWQADWTMFYWGWWISWSPFVGMFIARVSRGRTIRAFVLGVLLVPTLLTFVWMVVFGNTAIYMELFGDSAVAEAVTENLPTGLFVMLLELPWGMITSALATLVIAVFFVTSSDSASLVVDILTSGGSLHPPVWQRIFWAVFEGVVAAVLLLTGGLLGLRSAAIATALPFSVVMLMMCYSLVRGLRAEARAPLPSIPLGLEVEEDGGDLPTEERDWREQLKQIMGRPVRPPEPDQASMAEARRSMSQFIDQTAIPAFHSLAKELQRRSRETSIERHEYQAQMTVAYEGKEEFRYAIRTRALRPVTAAFPEMDSSDVPRIVRAEIVVRGAPHRDYPLDRLNRQDIIEDFLHEYAKWMGW